MRLLRLLTLALVAAISLFPAPFTPGNLVIYRVGDGAAALTSAGTAVFLDEYTPSGALVQSIPIPTTTSGANRRLVASGTATTEGQLTRSVDGLCLVLPGYDAALATASLTTSTSAAVNRVIARVDTSGAINTTTALTDASTGSSPRSAASTNCTDIWMSGGAGSVRYTTLGATTSTQLSTTVTNMRAVAIYGGQLYTSTQSGTIRLGTVGSGIPTTSGQTIANLPGFSTSSAPNQFFLADLNAGVAGVDTLYVADESAGQILKYSLVAGTWTSNGTITAASVRGLTASVSGSTVTLFGTYSAGSKLAKVVDTAGYNAAPSTTTVTDLATAPANTGFRGVAFAPISGLPSLSINDVSLNEGDAGTTSFTFTVSLSSPAGAAGVTFDIATADNTAASPSDYTAKSMLGQTISNGNSTYTFTVLVNGDTTVEPDETFFVNVTNVTGATVLDGQGLGTIVNDDAGSTNPSGTGSASPNPVTAGNSTTLSANITAGTNPSSTGIAVACNLTAIGGSAAFSLPFSSGSTYSAAYSVPGATAAQAYSLPCTVTDSQSRSGAFNIALTVTPSSTAPSGTGSANPNSLQAGAGTLLTVSVTPGTNPASTGLAVSANLSSIGGSATQQFFDNATNGDVTAGDNIFSFQATVDSSTTPGLKSLPVTIGDSQMRSGNTSIALTVQFPPAPTSIKVSQVYGGGGNSGSTYKNDFIELFNQSTSPVDISLWSVQTTSATGTTWNITNLCPPASVCMIQPGHYYLVQESQGAGGTTSLPSPDITGTIAMGAGSGKVALLNNTTALSGACPVSTSIGDFAGYGGTGTDCSETTPVGSLSNTSAAVRKGNGCIDTGNNSNDFVIVGPIPRNSGSPANTCGGNPAQPSGVGTASPASVDPAGITLLTVTVTPATSPASTGLAVAGDLTSIGGSASQPFYDDGTHGDVTAGDNVFSFRATIPAAATTGAKSVQTTITDAQARTATAPITLTVQSPTCGVERWAVKTGTDPNVGQVDLNNPLRTTVSSLRAIPAPVLNPNPPYDPRFAPTETTVFVVNGTLTLYKLEADVDYHIVLRDTAGNTMITEIPSPACDGSSGPFDALVAAVRAKFDGRFTAIGSFQTANQPVQMKGVGFFDFLHGQTGVAPNGIELHPVLDINFTTSSTTALGSSVNPSNFGQPVTFTATVTSGGGTATGNVSFFDGAALLGTGTLAANAQATFTTSTLSAGAHSITASYEGDSVVAESISSAFAQNVNQTYQLNLTVSPNGGGTTSPASGAFYPSNSIVNISATPNSGYQFVNWTGAMVGDANSAATTITMDAPHTVQANFSALATNIGAASGNKAGPLNARQWNFSIVNTGPGAANAAQIGSFTMVQSGGPACSSPPVVGPVSVNGGAPQALPNVPLGNMAPNSSIPVVVTIDFSTCPTGARFTETMVLSANGGSTSASVPRYNQFP